MPMPLNPDVALGEPKNHHTLIHMLDSIAASLEGERVKLGSLFDSLNRKGFGPLLLIPALLVISPVGALPGACAVLGGILFLASLQILLGIRQLWLPQRLRQMTFRGTRLCNGIKRVRPYAVKIDKYLENRFSVLARNEVVLRITALISMALSIGIISLSIVPLAPALFALPVLFFAIGLSVHDGIILVLGYIVLLIGVVAVPFLFEGMA